MQEIERIDTTKDVAGIHPVWDVGDLGSTILWYYLVTTARANSISPCLNTRERLTVSQLCYLNSQLTKISAWEFSMHHATRCNQIDRKV